MPTDHPSDPDQGGVKALEKNTRPGKKECVGMEGKESVSSHCLQNTCSPRLRERESLLTSVYTNDSELGSILGEEQMALRI